MRWEDVVCQGLAVFVIVFCHFSVACLCRSLESSWLIPSFHFLVFHVYMYWLLSVFSDPGYYYAKSPIMTASKSIDMDIPSVQLQKSKDGKLLVFHDAEFPLDDSKVVGYSFSINPCFKCRHYKPPRCHHCRTCGKCVLRYDHHCPWIGNCIGQGNVSYFNRFLIFTPASLFYAIWLLLRQFYDWKKSQFLGLSELEIGRGATLSGWYIVWMAITFVILIVTAILVSAMAYYHICVYALHNMTTLDNIAMDEDMSLYESQFIYNLGSWPRNWRNVMGNGLGFGIWGWSKCQGDGINHKVNHLAIHVTEKDEKVVNQAFKKDNFQEDAFKKDNFQEDAFKNDDFQEDAFKNDDFQEDAFKKDDFQKDTFKKDDFQKDTFKKDVDDSTDDKLKRR